MLDNVNKFTAVKSNNPQPMENQQLMSSYNQQEGELDDYIKERIEKE